MLHLRPRGSQWLPEPVRRGLTFWRRSIQARVVASTVLLSIVVISVVGWYLLRQTRDGLLDHRVNAVVAEANDETAEARKRLDAVVGTDADVAGQLRELVEQIDQRGDSRGFAVVLSGPTGPDGRIADGGALYTRGLDTSSVPVSLERHFDDSTNTAWTYTTIRSTDRDGVTTEQPGIVVGSQVQLPADAQSYTLFYLFPLDEQQETLALVSRALLTAAVLLVVLVAGMTWLVTRQVVTPIRMARQVAERLAAGQLQERLRVSGEDDLARLATSFNQMASNLQRQIRQLEELSRVQRRFAAGAAVLETDDVNLVDVVHRVVDAAQPLARKRGVEVAVRAPDRPCLAEADVRRVERILRNLVTNAIDHAAAPPTPGVPAIVVSVDADEQAAAVAVRDYGVGLAPGESAMVFNRFWRADPARDRSSGGTGLGLAISLEDTHLHGGWLQAWGRPGGGAQFRLTLPRRVGGPLHHSPLPLVPADAGERAS